jgi:ATP-dependent DNA ligase
VRPLASDKMSVDVPPPKTTRFGKPLVLSRAHWVRPKLVAEVTYLTWTADGLLSSAKGCARTRRRGRFAASVESRRRRTLSFAKGKPRRPSREGPGVAYAAWHDASSRPHASTSQ